MARSVALIAAAGSGSRAAGGPDSIPKQYREVAGKPMIVHAIEAFAAVPGIEKVAVVISPDDAHFERLEISDALARSLRVLRVGGETRARSVQNGLDALRAEFADADWVLVHDAARCGVTPSLIAALIESVHDDVVGGLLALPIADTIKRAGGEPSASNPQRVEATLDRSNLWQAQTPQMFPFGMLRDALLAASRRNLSITDEASAIEAAGFRPRLIVGDTRNFKVTTADDLAMMDALLLAERNGLRAHRS